MRLRNLQLMVTIADLESLQKAASSLGLSQPAATHALSETEKLIGAKIFERHSQGMRTTVAGKMVIQMARKVLLNTRDCAEALATFHQGAKSSIRVGANAAAISAIIAPRLEAYSNLHPEMVIDVVEVGNDGIQALTDNRFIDVVITRQSESIPAGFASFVVCSDHYAVVCGPDHPLAKKSKVEPEDLAGFSWLMPPSSSVASRDFHHFLDHLNIEHKFRGVESRNILVLLRMLEHSTLLAFVPFQKVSELIRQGLIGSVACHIPIGLAPLSIMYDIGREKYEPALHAFVSYFSDEFNAQGA